MRTHLTTVTALTALLVSAATSSAQTPTSNRGDFSGPVIDWGAFGAGDGHAIPNPGTISAGSGTVTVSSPNSTITRLDAGSGWGGGFTPGDHLLFLQGTPSVTFDFSSPITGFGTQVWFDFSPGTVTLSEYFGGILRGTFSFSTGGSGAANSNQATLAGVLDNTGFDRVVLTGSTSYYAFNQASLNVSQVTSTPEPASLVLLGTGLVGVFAAAGRRSRRPG